MFEPGLAFRDEGEEEYTMHIQPFHWAMAILDWPNAPLLCDYAKARLQLQHAAFEMELPIKSALKAKLNEPDTLGIFNTINALNLSELTALNAGIAIIQEDPQLSKLLKNPELL